MWWRSRFKAQAIYFLLFSFSILLRKIAFLEGTLLSEGWLRLDTFSCCWLSCINLRSTLSRSCKKQAVSCRCCNQTSSTGIQVGCIAISLDSLVELFGSVPMVMVRESLSSADCFEAFACLMNLKSSNLNFSYSSSYQMSLRCLQLTISLSLETELNPYRSVKFSSSSSIWAFICLFSSVNVARES